MFNKPPVLTMPKIDKALEVEYGERDLADDSHKVACRAQRDADLKWFVEWGKELCPHSVSSNLSYPTTKRLCAMCWQALQKEGGEWIRF